MGLTKENLLCHSRWIRDHLAPKIAKDGSLAPGKHSFDLAPLRSALDELIESPMTLDILRFSRMEKALQRIVEANTGDWPPDIVLKAKNLIARWENSFGPLLRVRTDLWATGGRLEGFAKPRGWFKWEEKSPEAPAWIAQEKRSLAETYKEGHCGVKVGEWWLNSTAACRAGIIDNLYYRITSDNHVAYAITMTQGTETNVTADGRSSYTPYANDPGAVKLMATIGGEQRSTIRVLRSWRLRSSLAPAAGLRYDGADDSRYRVTGYGVKLIPGSDKSQDTWRYTFHLERENGQESIEKVLGIPMPDQLDDWEDYKAGPMYSPEEEVTEQMGEGMNERKRRYTIGEDTGGRLGSIDSGYFSSHPSALKGEVRSPSLLPDGQRKGI
ncbi:MAG: hypothetical protein L6R38_003759 [Xanthoria sp. 2 TBL-2021]|nr:MAG: hypothetical protein L6R38_003759 [Xanthoria sp. 2 TBL-2021]